LYETLEDPPLFRLFSSVSNLKIPKLSRDTGVSMNALTVGVGSARTVTHKRPNKTVISNFFIAEYYDQQWASVTLNPSEV
jgi:hypothetical protein